MKIKPELLGKLLFLKSQPSIKKFFKNKAFPPEYDRNPSWGSCDRGLEKGRWKMNIADPPCETGDHSFRFTH